MSSEAPERHGSEEGAPPAAPSLPPRAPASIPPGFAADGDVSAALRARATGWIAIVIAVFGWGQAVILALHRLKDIDPGPLLEQLRLLQDQKIADIYSTILYI